MDIISDQVRLAPISSSREKKELNNSKMKVEILFFICLSFVGQSLESNNVVESGSDLENEVQKRFSAVLGRPCLLDEQCIKELSYCDRSKGLSAKISQDLVRV